MMKKVINQPKVIKMHKNNVEKLCKKEIEIL